MVLLGDINCDLLAQEPCCYTKRLKCITSTSHLHQLINVPTRITEDTESLIDHVYVSDVNKVVDSGVSHVSISRDVLIDWIEHSSCGSYITQLSLSTLFMEQRNSTPNAFVIRRSQHNGRRSALWVITVLDSAWLV